MSANCTAGVNSTAVFNSTAGVNATAGGSGTFSDPCLPAVYLGFAGSDKHHRTFQSGYQITKINQFSLVAFYQRAANTVSGAGCYKSFLQTLSSLVTCGCNIN